MVHTIEPLPITPATHVPVWSTLTAWTGCGWQSTLATGSGTLGVQRLTTPREWPRQITAVAGFWHITPRRPIRVLVCVTIRPVLTSSQFRKPRSV